MQVNGMVTVAMEESKVSRGVIDGWISETWCLSVDARLKRWRVVSLSLYHPESTHAQIHA